MSESRREYDKMSNRSSSENRGNSKDETERYSRKRTHLQTNSHPIENLDAKVYVGNISTDKVTDDELLDFFKPFGKVSDIRVFKNYIFVQYNRADDARKLIDQGQISLVFKGNKLDILPAAEAPSTEKSSKSHEKTSHRYSLKSEPTRKRFSTQHIDRDRSNFMINNTNVYNDRVEMEIDDHIYISSSSRSCSRQSSINSLSRNQQTLYSVLTGPKNPTELVDCQIILVNARQREYADEIESRLCSHGLVTSIVLLREDFTLTEAIDSAARQQCLFGIVAMPMHEERRTASFHILYGQTEEHRNLTLEDGYHIIINNFLAYKERFRNEEVDSYRENNETIIYSEQIQSYEYIPQLSNASEEEEINPPALTLGDKLPLSMLLCLLADGRQLTLNEIDRALVYLLEKKAKMLTLPSGTLPPLPAQYATIPTLNHQTGSGIVSDTRSASTSDTFSGKSSSSSAEVSSSIAEQIRQILSTNVVKPHSSTSIPIEKKTAQHSSPTNSLETLPNIVKVEDTTSSQSKKNVKEAAKEYVQYQQTQQRQVQAQAQNIISQQQQQQQQQQQTAQASFSYPKTETTAVNASSFNYSSPSGSTTGSVTSFCAPNFSTYNSMTPSLTLNSSIKATTPVTVPSFGSQTAQYYYQVPTQNIYQPQLNSTAADAAAALFQAYAQFNVPSTATPSMVSQQIMTQQQQIKK